MYLQLSNHTYSILNMILEPIYLCVCVCICACLFPKHIFHYKCSMALTPTPRVNGALSLWESHSHLVQKGLSYSFTNLATRNYSGPTTLTTTRRTTITLLDHPITFSIPNITTQQTTHTTTRQTTITLLDHPITFSIPTITTQQTTHTTLTTTRQTTITLLNHPITFSIPTITTQQTTHTTTCQTTLTLLDHPITFSIPNITTQQTTVHHVTSEIEGAVINLMKLCENRNKKNIVNIIRTRIFFCAFYVKLT